MEESAKARMVKARSPAEMPVLVPWMRSTESVKAVRLLSVLRSTMRGRSSSSQRSPVSATQITPDV